MYIVHRIACYCMLVCYSNRKPTDCTVVKWQFSGAVLVRFWCSFGAVLVRIFSMFIVHRTITVNNGKSESMLCVSAINLDKK